METRRHQQISIADDSGKPHRKGPTRIEPQKRKQASPQHSLLTHLSPFTQEHHTGTRNQPESRWQRTTRHRPPWQRDKSDKAPRSGKPTNITAGNGQRGTRTEGYKTDRRGCTTAVTTDHKRLTDGHLELPRLEDGDSTFPPTTPNFGSPNHLCPNPPTAMPKRHSPQTGVFIFFIFFRPTGFILFFFHSRPGPSTLDTTTYSATYTPTYRLTSHLPIYYAPS
jgi:hypothetical protein